MQTYSSNFTIIGHKCDRILPPCNYCHHPWWVGDKSYHKALFIMFSCDGISDHAGWNEVFHYRDTKFSWILCTYLVNANVTCDNSYLQGSSESNQNTTDQFNSTFSNDTTTQSSLNITDATNEAESTNSIHLLSTTEVNSLNNTDNNGTDVNETTFTTYSPIR